MQRQRQVRERAKYWHGAGRNVLCIIGGSAFIGVFVPPGAVSGAATNAPSTGTTATGTRVLPGSSTLIPLTTVVLSGAEPSEPLVVTLQPIHPTTSTPPRPNGGATPTLTPAPGTPRARSTTATRMTGSPVQGTATRANRSPTAVPVRGIVPIAPIISTPIPTLALPPTPASTAAAASNTATVTPDQLPAAGESAAVAPVGTPMGTPTPGADILPSVVIATLDGNIPLELPADATPTKAPSSLLARGGGGGVVALAVFVLVLGVVGVVSGIAMLARGRHA